MSKNSGDIFKRGSSWIKCDLQIHTPGCFSWSGPGSIKDVLSTADQKGLSIISLVNHNCFDGYFSYLSLSRTNEEKYKTLDVVLPGIEINIKRGKGSIHAILLFPERTPKEKLEIFLSKADLTKQQLLDYSKEVKRQEKRKTELTEKEKYDYGKRYKGIELKDLKKVRKELLEESDLQSLMVIHADKARGVDRDLDKSVKGMEYDELIMATDIVEISSKDRVKKYHDDERWKRKIPCIFTSDAHNLGEIGQKYVWIKAKPTFEGLRQIIYEPERRVCLDEKPPKYIHYQIAKVSLEQDKTDRRDYCFKKLKKDPPVYFSPNLTTIIGSRGTGKSTLVELLSYVFDKHTSMVSGSQEKTIIQFHQVNRPRLKVDLIVQAGERLYEIWRALDEKAPIENEAFSIEIDYWPQGKIEQIAKDKNEISKLVNKHLESDKLEEFWSEVKDARQALKEKRQSYLQIYGLRKKKLQIEKELREIELYFKKLKGKDFRKIYQDLQTAHIKKQTIDNFREVLRLYIEKIDHLNQEFSELEKPSLEELRKLLPSLKSRLKNFYSEIENDLKKVSGKTQELLKEVDNSKEYKSLINSLGTTEEEFRQYCEDHGIKLSKHEVKEKRERKFNLTTDLRKIDRQIEYCNQSKREHAGKVEKLQEAFQKWEELNKRLVNLFNKRFEKTEIRAIYEADIENQINWAVEEFSRAYNNWRELSERMIVGLERFQRDYLIHFLETEIFTERKLDPIELLRRSLDKKKLPTKTKSKFLEAIFTAAETEPLRDELIMRMSEFSIRGLNKIQYKEKSLEELSFGEKCGTILLIILSSGEGPLIIDQPEAHLDSQFVVNELIPLIQNIKEKRQILICTRDPNLVVLADSELIVVLKDEDRDDVTENIVQGALEDNGMRKEICDVLEGGELAFLKREKRYSLGIIRS